MKIVSALAAGIIAALATLAAGSDAKASSCPQAQRVVYHCEPYYVPPAPVIRQHVWRPRVARPRPVVRRVVHRAPSVAYRTAPVLHMCCINNMWQPCSGSDGAGGYAASGYVSTAGLGRWAE
jgi:hypothetical protein